METEVQWYLTPRNHKGDEVGPEIEISMTCDFDFPSGDITLLHIADGVTGRTIREPNDKDPFMTVTHYEKFVWAFAERDVMHDDELRSRIARQAEEDRHDAKFEAHAYEEAS